MGRKAAIFPWIINERMNFKILWGPSGTKSAILTYNTYSINAQAGRFGPMEFLAGLYVLNALYLLFEHSN